MEPPSWSGAEFWECYNNLCHRFQAEGRKCPQCGQDVKTYSEDVKAQYQNTADDFVLLAEEDTAVDGTDCRLFEFTYAIRGGDASQDMQCMTAVIIKDERVYIVTCKSHRDTFMTYRQPFRKMLESIRIADETFPAAGSSASAQTVTNAQSDVSAVTAVS